jgi:peptidyl-tRNA hydrolase
MQIPSYKVKLRAIQVVKQWFDRTQEPIVMSTAHLDALLGCIEEALHEGVDTEQCGGCLGQRVKGTVYHCES